MNYIELINNFWSLDETWQFSCCETRLYFYLLKTANRSGWENIWAHSDNRTSANVGVSINLLKSARNKLVSAGLILFSGGGKGFGNKTRYQILTPNSQPNSQPNSEPNSQPNSQPIILDKLNKTKQNNNFSFLNKKEKFYEEEEEKSPLEMSEVEIVDFGTSFPKICLPGKIVENYHAICISLGKVRLLTKERDKKIRLRFAEMESAGFEPYAAFSLVFEKMQDSDFCNGKNERGWRADFDFSVRNDKNWLKIYEGKYDNQPVARKLDVCERNMQNFREVMKYFNKQQENE